MTEPTMPIISVLTPTQQARRDFLLEAGRSLMNQALPPSWTLEWIVQEDGESPKLSEDVALFPFARYQSNRKQLGEGQTRNLALVRALGELVHVLDDDDLLLPGALAMAIDTFANYPQIHWVAAQVDDLLPGNRRVSITAPITPGIIEPGVVNDYICDVCARNEPFLWPVHTAGLTIRTTTIRALGGWGSYPVGADVALLTALTELTPGYLLSTITWLYRRHSQQVTASNDWKDLAPQIAAQRITAIRELGLGCL
ncbi:glycosyltransferase [Mycobacterium riyadhense]|uniref:glycosyltransferase n=2 Tax=Mycobacterium riyadhense TaxID=486698 RepID=UPI001958D138|nr:glycosyltransferase [Mycobacterium riyadhense]